MNERDDSIFREYYADQPFVDRFCKHPEQGVDVIIPVFHTNELWEANLASFFREIPIHTLLIGDGGCIDDSIAIARKFPRIKVLDHRNYRSLGYSIRGLIEAVETDWFIYVHSDAYLPPGWFDAMSRHKSDYDWFGCPMRHTVMVEYDGVCNDRPWAGSQMGRKRAFEAGLERIDDDYVYRQEDFVFADIVKKAGFKEGKISDTFHYHQTMRKQTPSGRKVNRVDVQEEMSPEEQVRTSMTMAKGIVKYLDPPVLVDSVIHHVNLLQEMGELDWEEFYQWVEQTNPRWLPLLHEESENDKKPGILHGLLRKFRRSAYRWTH